MDEAWLVDAAAWAAVAPYRAAPGVVVADTGRLRWYRTPVAYEGLNGVLWARLPEDGLAAAVEAALAPFRETGVPMLWHLGPTSAPPSLPRALEAAGLARHEDEPGMVADLAALGPPAATPAGLEVVAVGDEDGLAAWCRVWAGLAPGAEVGGLVEVRAPKALGAGPPVPHLLAVLDGIAVGCAAVLAGDGRGRRPAGAGQAASAVPAMASVASRGRRRTVRASSRRAPRTWAWSRSRQVPSSQRARPSRSRRRAATAACLQGTGRPVR
jgi:hypothetical protein